MTLLLCAVLGNAWGTEQVSNLTFTKACNGSGTANDGVSWTVTSDAAESTFDSNSGIHYGTNSATVKYLQLSTSGISGNIKKVVVNTRDAQAIATVRVTVGGNQFGSTYTATNTSTDYTFNGNANGNIVVRIERNSAMKKAIYVKSVVVTYETGPSLPTPTLSYDDYIEVAMGATETITVSSDYTDGEITCVSNNTGIATVSGSNGSFTITGVAEGTTTLTVTQEGTDNHNPATATIEVEVYDPRELANLIVSPTTVVVFVDENKSVNIDSDSDGQITFSGYDDNVATIEGSNGNYTITGVSVGTTTITVNQAETTEYQSATATINVTVNRNSYATLPFSFTGGRSDIASTDGLSQSGLGTDYGDATCKLRIDNTGDYVILHFNETPGELSFNIKSNSFSDGQFTVQTSTDGITYTNLKTYTSDDNISAADNGQSEEFNLAADVRYIKWIYTEKVSGNIGLGNIKVEKYVAPKPTEIWVKTDLADLTEDDIFVIVGNNGDNYAMSNDKGTAPPTAISVIVLDDKITTTVTDNIKWNVSGDATNGYTFYPNGDKENWLYLKDKNTNKGVCVGTTENGKNLFTLSDGYLYNKATERYIGIYGSADWRCYTSTTTNISGQTFAFYKLVKVTISIKSEATDGTTCYATISELGDNCYKVVGDVEVRTVNVINGKLNYPVTFYEGDVFPGNGAYLVVGAAGSYTFPAVLGSQPLPDNALKSSGKSGVTKSEMETLHGSNNKFYKLSKRNGKIGFYWGADNGEAFKYETPRQAYLVVPQEDGQTGSAPTAYFFDGDATGIYSVNAEIEGTEAEGVYSLSGIRMDGKQLPKGVYIVNGKKKVIK